MPVYIVRRLHDGGLRDEFAGIYIAQSFDELRQFVESGALDADCQYAIAPHDNMYAPEVEIPGLGRLYSEETEAEVSPGHWSRLFFGDGDVEWKPISPALARSHRRHMRDLDGSASVLAA
jgi:hypothetical protein